MANPHRGEVALHVGDKTYTLSLSVNAICELEELLGEPVTKIAASLRDPEGVRLTTVRALVWAALRDHHEGVTMKDAGSIATEAGVPAVMAAIGECFNRAFPSAEEPEGNAAGAAKGKT